MSDINNKNNDKDFGNDDFYRKEYFRMTRKKVKNYKEDEHNKLSYIFIEKVKEYFGSSAMTIRNTLTSLFGSEILFNKIEYNEEISNAMTDMFVKTKVNVFVYHSSSIQAFTYDGNLINSSPLILRLHEIFQQNFLKHLSFIINPFLIGGYYLGSMFSTFLIALERILKHGYDATMYGLQKIEYFPDIKKANINVGMVNIYISSALIIALNNDREMKAVLLHEIGHNLDRIYSTIEGIVDMLSSSLIVLMIKSLYEDGKDPRRNELKTCYFAICLLSLFVYFIIAYFRKKEEIIADELSIKMGYGEDLYKALGKMTKAYGGLKAKIETYYQLKDKNPLQKVLANLFSMYPLNRMEMIKQKTLKYDFNNSNIDRTDPLYYEEKLEDYSSKIEKNDNNKSKFKN